MHHKSILGLLWMLSTVAFSQSRYHTDSMSMEHLDRGLVAVRQSEDSVVVSWRLLNEDPKMVLFDLYADDSLIVSNTIKTYISLPTQGLDFSHPNTFKVVAKAQRGLIIDRSKEATYSLPADAPMGYIDIPLNKPADAGEGTPFQCQYAANDCSVADVDGDGQLEIIVKWNPSNAHDNSHDGYTGHVLVDCYSLTPLPDRAEGDSSLSHFKWRIDLGRNIRAGAHYTQIMAYDLDGDHKAEVVMKTADGTIDGLGNVIGDSTANYVNENGKIMSGPEYLTVFSGETGQALYTTDYVPDRGEPGLWGDSKANRSERYLAGVGYLGNSTTVRHGKKDYPVLLPSVIMCRGYYTRTTLVAWDWDGKELKQRWFFDSYEGAELKRQDTKMVVSKEGPWGAYSKQGNHSLIVADVDMDGFDEIIYGSCTIDHDGKGLYSTGLGHGDAMHLGPMLPNDNRLYVWQCHETMNQGCTLRDARTGKIIHQVMMDGDCGRCMAGDIDPTNPGYEMWSIHTKGILNYKGEVIANPKGLTFNMGIYWDGDIYRELLDRTSITKYNWVDKTIDRLVRFEGVHSNNGTKANPSLVGDILGDWREEVLFPTLDNKHLRIFVTPYPTAHRIPTLLQNVVYRHSLTIQNVGYNQPTQMNHILKTNILR